MILVDSDMDMLCGVGYRRPLHDWIMESSGNLQCLELTAEHFFDGRLDQELNEIRGRFPVFLHGLGLSLGSSGSLNPRILRQFKEVVDRCDPLWVSEHIAFTSTSEVDLGHLNPVPHEMVFVRRIADKAKELSDRCGKPVLLENITSSIRFSGQLSETDFLNRICEEGDCGLLLDVTNLYVNSRNHKFDPLHWLNSLDPKRIGQLHIVGYREADGKFFDSHSNPVQEDLWDLFKEVIKHSGVEATIIERDVRFDNAEKELTIDLHRMRGIVSDG